MPTPNATKSRPDKSISKSSLKHKNTPKTKSRNTLSELSLNTETTDQDDMKKMLHNVIDGQVTLRITPEICSRLEKDKQDYKEFIIKNLNDQCNNLELVGWSENGPLPTELYDRLLESNLNAKRLILRGRGEWATCYCPKTKNKFGELIDTITEERTTSLEHVIVIRTFAISSCALLDLISRSPKLKTVKFYGSLINENHHIAFQAVRFLSELEGVHWPWCNVKAHKPTLRTLVKRQDSISTFYSSADITCDFLGSDLLPNLRYLSLIMNENWICSSGKTKILKRYNRNINFLKKAQRVEALEVRTFDVNGTLAQNEKEDADTHEIIRRNFETYKLQFWENVSELAELKYMAIHGAWELEEVCRDLSKRGLQIEYLRISLMPSSIMTNLEENKDNTTKHLILSMSDASKHISKLAKLKSLHFTCHDNLSNIDEQTASALKELSDLIWKLDIKSAFTSEVEELLTNILRRGNQNGRSYRIRILIQPEDPAFSNIYTETIEKFSSNNTLRGSLTEAAQQKVRERFGKNTFKTFSIWGIEQAGGGRDKVAFDQLVNTWGGYELVFNPADMFV